MSPTHPPRLTSLLVPITLETLSSPLTRAKNLILEATTLLLTPGGPRPSNLRLFIILSSPEIPQNITTPVKIWRNLQQVLCELYAAASNKAFESDCPLFDVTIILEGWCGYDPYLIENIDAFVGYAEDQVLLASINVKRAKDQLSHLHLIEIPDLDEAEEAEQPTAVPEVAECSNITKLSYDHVALGGTFDHLHSGHKILLTIGAWLTQKRLICGVMELDPTRLSRKKASKQMEPLQTRVSAVITFLTLIRHSPNIQYDVVPIQDDYGPTITDSSIQAIVGSMETKKGCEAVNEKRREKGFLPLDIFVIDVISPNSAKIGDGDMGLKISSTYIREWLQEHET